MSKAHRFEVGKYYQFTGEPMVIRKGESMFDKVGAVFEPLIEGDVEILQNWMDRCIRKCLYSDSIDGTSAVFEDIFFQRNKDIPWTVVRSYSCYLKEGMFREVEVNG